MKMMTANILGNAPFLCSRACKDQIVGLLVVADPIVFCNILCLMCAVLG